MSINASMSNTEINLGECCDLLEQSSVIQSIDLGSAVIHNVKHPVRGLLTLINTACGRSAVLSN